MHSASCSRPRWPNQVNILDFRYPVSAFSFLFIPLLGPYHSSLPCNSQWVTLLNKYLKKIQYFENTELNLKYCRRNVACGNGVVFWTKAWLLLFYFQLFYQKYFYKYIHRRYILRFFDCIGHPNLNATLATDQKWTLSCLHISYQSLAECHLPKYYFPY